MSRERNEGSEFNERYPNFRYELLDIPPEDWELYDIPDKTHLRNRALDLGTYKKLVRHHTWGFEVSITDRKTKQRLLERLKRIIYNQDPALRPTWHAFVSRNCDAGPRLLKRKYNALQISRWFPDGVPGQPLRLGPTNSGGNSQDTSRPLPQNPPGYVVGNEARNSSISPASQLRPSEFPSLLQPMNISHQSFADISGSAQGRGGYTSQIGSCNPGLFPSTAAPSLQKLPQNQQRGQVVPTCRRPSASDAFSIPTPLSVQMPDASPQPVQQPVPQLLLCPPSSQTTSVAQSAMGGCQSQPATDGLPPPPTASPLDAVSSSHVRVFASGGIPSFILSEYGSSHPLRGCGPMSEGPSDAVHCLVAAAKLLDIRQTASQEDESDDTAAARRSIIEIMYIGFSSVTWKGISGGNNVEDPARLRDACRQYIRAKDSCKTSDPSTIPLTLGKVWEACTRSFRRFQVQFTATISRCPCEGDQSPEMRSGSTPYIMPETLGSDGSTNTDLDSCIRRFFQYERAVACRRCASGGRHIIRRQFAALPPTLVISPDPFVRFQSHSSGEIIVEYTNPQRQLQKVTYRWLGGIYPLTIGQDIVHKVFWNDHVFEGSEADPGALCVYDAAEVYGAIIGGVHLDNQQERVPAAWWAPNLAPLLFYERISEDVLNQFGPMLPEMDQKPLGGDNDGCHGLPERPAQTQTTMAQDPNASAQGIQPEQSMRDPQEPRSGSTTPKPQLSACFICSGEPYPLYKEESSQQPDTQRPTIYDPWPTSPAGTLSYMPDGTKPIVGTRDIEPRGLGVQEFDMSMPRDPQRLTPGSDGTITISRQMTHPQFAESPASAPVLEPEGPALDVPALEATNADNTFQTENVLDVPDLPSDSGSRFPPLPDLGSVGDLGDLLPLDVEWLTGASMMEPSSSAFFGATAASSEVHSSLPVKSISSQNEETQQQAADNGSSTIDHVGTIDNNSAFAEKPLEIADFGATATASSTGYNVFDQLLNDSCLPLACSEVQSQQQGPRSQQFSDYVVFESDGGFDRATTAFAPALGPIDDQSVKCGDDKAGSRTKRKSVAGMPESEDQYGSSGPGDIGPKRPKM